MLILSARGADADNCTGGRRGLLLAGEQGGRDPVHDGGGPGRHPPRHPHPHLRDPRPPLRRSHLVPPGDHGQEDAGNHR